MKKTAFLFPGQGSQILGMGKSLYEYYPVVKRTFEEACDILGYDIKEMCFEGSLETLTETQNVQPALLVTSVSAFKVFMDEVGIEPTYLTGHSLGEYSALTCAGVIDFADAVRIVRQRGLLMSEVIEDGAMAAINGIGKQIVEEICDSFSKDGQTVAIACHNSPFQYVISGHSKVVKIAGEKLETLGAGVVFLRVSNAFHSPLMEAAAAKIETELKKYEYSSFKWPVISNVTSTPYRSPNEIIGTLTLQMTKGVRWQETMKFLQDNGIELGVEMGPKNVLKKLVKENTVQIIPYSLEKQEDVQILGEVFLDGKKTSETTDQEVSLVTKCLAAAVCTRNSNWDDEEYHKGVVEPYRIIERIQLKLDDEKRKPTVNEMEEAVKLLTTILITKKVPAEEQRERLHQILKETGTKDLFGDLVS